MAKPVELASKKGTKNKAKKQRKFDRNKKFCEVYARDHTREKNKIKKLEKHLKRFPDDAAAVKSLETLRGIV